MIDKMRSLLPVFILGTFILAAAAIWAPRGSESTTASSPTLKELDERLSSGSARLSGLIEVTNERPVFHASRRPVAAPETPKAPEPVLQLLGIIAEDNVETLAFVKVSTDSTLYRVGEGETVGRWRVLDVGTDAITVSKDGDTPFTLRIGG